MPGRPRVHVAALASRTARRERYRAGHATLATCASFCCLALPSSATDQRSRTGTCTLLLASVLPRLAGYAASIPLPPHGAAQGRRKLGTSAGLRSLTHPGRLRAGAAGLPGVNGTPRLW